MNRSLKWRARVVPGLMGVILLAVVILKFPDVGWWGIGFSIIYLILVFTVVGRESKRAPRPFKQRRLINTAALLVGSTIALTGLDIVRGKETWDGFLFALFLSAIFGAIGWFGTQPDEQISPQNSGTKTR